MRLDEEQILAIGGYDVLVYLRFQALSLKIFGSFAPYAVILLIVNMSASYDDGPSLPNLFTRLSLAVIPERDPRLWAHLLGIVILTSLTFHWLGRECRWYTRLRHRFLLERPDARVVFRKGSGCRPDSHLHGSPLHGSRSPPWDGPPPGFAASPMSDMAWVQPPSRARHSGGIKFCPLAARGPSLLVLRYGWKMPAPPGKVWLVLAILPQ